MEGIVQAMGSLFYAMALLTAITMMFAIIFKSYAENSPGVGPGSDYDIQTVADAFWILAIYGIFMDAVSELVLVLVAENVLWAILLMLFIACGNLTMLNMLIGILTEVVA